MKKDKDIKGFIKTPKFNPAWQLCWKAVVK